MNLAIVGAPGFGAAEMLLIVFVLLLLFGAKKLPEVARGSGRALRIFKAETKGLVNDDEDEHATPPPASGSHPTVQPQALTPPTPVSPPRPVEEPHRPDADR